MHPPAAPDKDTDLSRLLRSWRIEAPDDPALARKVWSRLEARPSAADDWLLALRRLLASPAAAALVVIVCALAGAAAAEWQHSSRREARLDRLATEYVRSIDPVRMTAEPGQGHH